MSTYVEVAVQTLDAQIKEAEAEIGRLRRARRTLTPEERAEIQTRVPVQPGKRNGGSRPRRVRSNDGQTKAEILAFVKANPGKTMHEIRDVTGHRGNVVALLLKQLTKSGAVMEDDGRYGAA